MDIKPFLHEHPLLYDEYEASCCDKCNLQTVGWAFTCETCEFWLHKSCAQQQLSSQISHPLHSQHLLTLRSSRNLEGQYFCCDKCCCLTRGYVYGCEDCGFNLDLICASSSTTNDQIQRSKTIHHFSHYDHQLTFFKYRKVKKYHHSCYWCHNLILSGLMSYGCLHPECSDFEVFFHESCLIDVPYIIPKHQFHDHASHPLQFRGGYDSCNACGGNFRFLEETGYSCGRCCRFKLHVGCVRLQPSSKHESSHHQHPLIYIPGKVGFHRRSCNICCMEIHSRIGFYHCMQCNISLHLNCIQIPLRTKHEYHRHELVLKGSYEEDVSDEYYCDMCEKRRKQRHPIYVCQKCSFVAHIGCALYKFGSTYNLKDNNASIQKPEQEEA